jgi:hypothetical protein
MLSHWSVKETLRVSDNGCQCVACLPASQAVTVRERGEIAPVLWADVEGVRAGQGV